MIPPSKDRNITYNSSMLRVKQHMQPYLHVHPLVEWMVAQNVLMKDIPPSARSHELDSTNPFATHCEPLTRFGELLNTLPFEILAEVFDWAGRVKPEDAATPARFFSPLRLSQVSNRWRKVATMTPRLWTHLRVVIRGRILGSALHLIRHWLERCKSCKIRIEVDFKEANGTEPAFLENVLGLFRQVAKEAAMHRFDFNMLRDGAVFETKLKASSLGVVPVIEERYLWYGGVQEVPNEENMLVAPLVIHGFRTAIDTFGLDYHSPLSSSLTSVDLRDTNELYCLSCTELLIILAEFPVLRRCAAYINHGDVPPSERVLATNLKRLSLSWHYTVDVGPFLDQLTAPSLDEFELVGDIPSGGRWDYLYNFVDRSRPPIGSLTLLHMDCNMARVEEVLAMCTASLRTLWLEDCLLDDDLVRSLSERPRRGRSVLDGLQSLGLVAIEGITGACLVETLKTTSSQAVRKGEGSEETLNEVFVYDCPGVTADDFHELNSLGFRKMEYIDVGAGLEVSDDDASTSTR